MNSLEETISNVGHGCFREAEAVARHVGKLEAPVTRADVLRGDLNGEQWKLDLAVPRKKLADAEKLLAKNPEATFTREGAVDSLKGAVETLRESLEGAKPYERR